MIFKMLFFFFIIIFILYGDLMFDVNVIDRMIIIVGRIMVRNRFSLFFKSFFIFILKIGMFLFFLEEIKKL